MKKIAISLLVSGVCLFATSTVFAELKNEGVANGPAFSALLGPNFCLDHNNATCSQEGVGFGMDLGFHYRFLSFFSIDFDFLFGTFSSDEMSSREYTNNQIRVLFGTTFHVPFESVDLSFSFGMGWGRHNKDQIVSTYRSIETYELSSSNFMVSWGISIDYRLLERMLLGVLVRHSLPLDGEACGDFEDVCEDGLVESNIMFGFRFAVYLMRPRGVSRPREVREEFVVGGQQICSPRSYMPCTCSNGIHGRRFCLAGGREWSRCGCSSLQSQHRQSQDDYYFSTDEVQTSPRVTAHRVCDPGATQACLCIGGDDGVQICEDSGLRWGACHCSRPPDQSQPQW